MSTTIPRFLLPKQSAMWHSRAALQPSRAVTRTALRHASSKAKPKPKTTATAAAASKPRVLEQPAKFNPPSHGARLRRDAPRYPGPALSSQQQEAQRTKKYPNMMPPEGSFLHWFLNNRSIHIYITLGTLFSLAGYTAITNFSRTSPFAGMLPQASDLFLHPIAFTRTCIEVLRLHTAALSAETAERRARKVEDVAKRAEFRKAHGLETEALGGWTAKKDADAAVGAELTAAGEVANAVDGGLGEHVQSVQREKRPLKKWFGIW